MSSSSMVASCFSEAVPPAAPARGGAAGGGSGGDFNLAPASYHDVTAGERLRVGTALPRTGTAVPASSKTKVAPHTKPAGAICRIGPSAAAIRTLNHRRGDGNVLTSSDTNIFVYILNTISEHQPNLPRDSFHESNLSSGDDDTRRD
eukprot:1359350-Prymnesium_polylepis.2